jgi:ABC-type Fe3+/spermidine/putrescine transport system ATPase subunit
MTSIRIVGLEKRFGEVRALADVDLAIGKGEFFTLLGPSGCGKTTLLRTIAGFHRQDKGEIWLGEECVDEVPAHRRDTGMVFQNYAVFPHLSVFENVAYGLRVRSLPKAEIARRVAAALKTVHLDGYEARTPDQLSGGQQQRVGLARAMAIEPRVLLFDEPLSNLDAKLRVEMREEIRAVQKQLGITAVYVTHDQEEALVISDRIAVIAGGRIQQVGEPWAVYKDPGNLFVASFVGKVNLLDAELAGAAGPGLARARVIAAGGEAGLELLVPASAPAGTRVKLAFRPEDAREDRHGEDARANPLSGTLLSSSFLGAVANLELACAQSRLVIERHRPQVASLPRIGDALTFSLPPEALMVFKATTGERLRPEPSR